MIPPGMIQGLLAKMREKQNAALGGIGAGGPQYNPGPTRTFDPGPQVSVPFMAPAQSPSQVINLGFGGNPNAVPGASMAPAGQTANYNQTPGTQAGAAAPKGAFGGFNPAMAQAAMSLLQRTRSEPLPWIQMAQSRWGGQG